MKKIISTAMAVLMGLTLFVGCSYNTKDYESGNAVGEKNAVISGKDAATFSGGYWSTASGFDADENAYYFNCGQWASYEMALATPIDCTGANTTITFRVKAADGLAAGEQASSFKVGIATGPTLANEYANSDTVTDFIALDNLTKEYQDYTFKVNQTWKMWSQDGSIKEAYLPCITKIIVNPQDSMKGKIFIESITVKNAE